MRERKTRSNPRIEALLTMMMPGGFAKPMRKAVAAEPHQSNAQGMTEEQMETAWKSIQHNLIQNRCWLCEEVFQRGKIKKVFMVSHLLQYLENLLKFVDKRNKKQQQVLLEEASVTTNTKTGGSSSEVNSVFNKSEDAETSPGGAPADGSGSNGMDVETNDAGAKKEPVVNTHMVSRNLLMTWAAFRAMDGDKERVARLLQKVDCEVWMSGLICARSKECASEYLLLVPDGKVSSSVMNLNDDNQFDADGYSKSRKGKVFRDKNGNVCPPGCDCDNPWQFIQAALIASEDLTETGNDKKYGKSEIAAAKPNGDEKEA